MDKLSVDSFLNVIGELFSDEISIVVSNKENYIYYRPSKRIDLKIKPGDPIKKGTITHKALSTQKRVSEFINKDVFGIPYDGEAIPFYRDGELQGCVTAVYPSMTQGKAVVTVKSNDGWVPIPFHQVIYLEAKERKTFVISEQHTGTHKYTLQEFEFILPKESFIRCHRSYIVNVNQIKEIYPDTHSTFVLSMTDGTRIPVSQSYSSYFRKLLSF
ncbi:MULTISPECIES: LytTR family DNA-binding domain-containing protein [Bacillus]|uniref:LytTR family DNA-binding domain-containing protein n=1 Tax=Bacillus TaxID=1386 RepID=UPI00031EE7F0|nr:MULTISPECIES: LytTR family DNA-binding domain-containing protein [Bacillus]